MMLKQFHLSRRRIGFGNHRVGTAHWAFLCSRISRLLAMGVLVVTNLLAARKERTLGSRLSANNKFLIENLLI